MQNDTINNEKENKGKKAIKRELHLFFLLDNSNSMAGEKAKILNEAIFGEAFELLLNVEHEKGVRIFVRAIRFGNTAEWHIGPSPVELSQFQRVELDGSGGSSSTAQAIELLREELNAGNVGNLPPICILVSDGYCTTPPGEYEESVDKLDLSEWGKKAVRLSVGIAIDGKRYDEEELYAFISPYLRKQGEKVLNANSPEKLRMCIPEAVRKGLEIVLGEKLLNSKKAEQEKAGVEEKENGTTENGGFQRFDNTQPIQDCE